MEIADEVFCAQALTAVYKDNKALASENTCLKSAVASLSKQLANERGRKDADLAAEVIHLRGCNYCRDDCRVLGTPVVHLGDRLASLKRDNHRNNNCFKAAKELLQAAVANNRDKAERETER